MKKKITKFKQISLLTESLEKIECFRYEQQQEKVEEKVAALAVKC